MAVNVGGIKLGYPNYIEPNSQDPIRSTLNHGDYSAVEGDKGVWLIHDQDGQKVYAVMTAEPSADTLKGGDLAFSPSSYPNGTPPTNYSDYALYFTHYPSDDEYFSFRLDFVDQNGAPVEVTGTTSISGINAGRLHAGNENIRIDTSQFSGGTGAVQLAEDTALDTSNDGSVYTFTGSYNGYGRGDVREAVNIDLNGSTGFSFEASTDGGWQNERSAAGSVFDFWGTDIDGNTVPCFTSNTLIETADGNKPVEDLRPGDMIATMDNGYQPIRWIGSTARDAVDLAHHPKLKPVRIPAGALGGGLPKRDLTVSRQHRVLVRSKIAQRMFGAEEILIPAIKLVGLAGIEIVEDCDSVTYFHILFDKHQVIFSEDAPTESLFTGPVALQSVSPEARKEIEILFPEITEPDFVAQSARPIPAKGAQIKQLVERHKKRDMPLLNN